MFLSAICLFACSEKKGTFVDETLICYEDFDSVQTLCGEKMPLDDVLLAPVQLQVYDTVLAVINNRSDKIIHLYGLNSEQKISEQVSVGQGPDDMLVPRFIENDGGSVLVSDLMTSAVAEYALDDFFKPEASPDMRRFSLGKRAFGEVRLLKDGYVGASRNPGYLLNRYNERGELVDSICAYPETGVEIADSEKLNMYSFSITTNQQDRIAVCYNLTDLIDIYDSKGKLCSRLYGPKHFISRFKEFNDGNVVSSVSAETRDAYFCPVNMGDEFWVLFSGKSESEDDYSILSNQIFVYGWDGTPRRILNLDQGIFAMAVDKKSRKIYGISDSPEFHILKYSY